MNKFLPQNVRDTCDEIFTDLQGCERFQKLTFNIALFAFRRLLRKDTVDVSLLFSDKLDLVVVERLAQVEQRVFQMQDATSYAAFWKQVAFVEAIRACTANGWRDHIRLFVEAWVSSEYYPRKRLSHYGAIRRSILTQHGCKISSSTELGRTPWGQKCKYIDPDHYFDPGNWHYKMCFVLLFGDVPWNENTVGDILESILGTRYLIENEGLACTHFPFAFATFLEKWCVALYRWFECTAWCNKSIAKVREALLIPEISDVI